MDENSDRSRTLRIFAEFIFGDNTNRKRDTQRSVVP